MNASADWHQFLLALGVLVAVHTAVSFGAYRFLTKTTVIHTSGEQAPVDVTTPEQAARGESNLEIVTESQVLLRTIPSVVVYYVWAGYAGLGLSGVVALVTWLRRAQ
jgi:hypothetical protein